MKLYCSLYFSIDSAEESSFAVKEGDVIVLATDGLFDNLSMKQIIEEISKLKVILILLFGPTFSHFSCHVESFD